MQFTVRHRYPLSAEAFWTSMFFDPDYNTRLYTEGLGFAGVLAGPLVRSSYRAGRLYQQAAESRRADRIVDSYGEVPHPR